ncbi:MAG: 23S rRNA (adenine(2503)-C(2))-methyltransferase RlmN [Firmicutes bacterium]|nr:23S rRNA (adenine(2503)-C(2))-methyltransferase RlmN [Bacillota bacterium]
MLVNIKDLDLTELEEWLISQGMPRYRGVQIFQWIHKHRVRSYDRMTNLPKGLREDLKAEAPLFWPRVIQEQVSAVDGTQKLLLELEDGERIETVLIPHKYGNSICVSSQVGCALACSFCATGISGFKRNLTVAEMVDQVLSFAEPVSSIVMMGMGEPLLNLENVLKFLAIIHNEHGFGIGYRHMTISTAGIPPGIRRLADTGLPITLAISLHAPNDRLRSELMPINKKYPISSVLDAADYYAAQTGRRYTLEYVLIDDVNDRAELARELVRLAKGRLCHVNLIPLNTMAEKNFERSRDKKVETFSKVLESGGIPVTVRREMGSDIDAACGQLRSRMEVEALGEE